MHPPCPHACGDDVPAVYGYGDANADFHLIGDHPGVHGGGRTGIPFTDAPAIDRLRSVFESVGLMEAVDGVPRPRNLFMSYLHMCCPPDGSDPTEADYLNLERFFDAELRAIAAHVLLPVGSRPVRHVLETHTARWEKLEDDPATYHAREVVGRGFLVIPIKEPAAWEASDAAALRSRLHRLLATDYRQTADLTRFSPFDDPYLVR